MEDLALHILDIVQNSLEAGAEIIDIDIIENFIENRLLIEIRDNGRGMDAEALAKATDPFFTTRKTRRVGMGLPLLAAAAKAADGSLNIDSKPGCGTAIKAAFKHGHIDRAPLGDLETTLMVLLAGRPDANIRFKHRVNERVFELESRDFIAAGIDLSSPDGLATLREAIRRGEAELQERV